MTIFYILIGAIALGSFNYFMAKRSNKKTLSDLQNYLITPKDNPFVNMYRIMGYGGGWAEFANGKQFGFCTDEALFRADEIIDHSASFQIASRTQS